MCHTNENNRKKFAAYFQVVNLTGHLILNFFCFSICLVCEKRNDANAKQQ